MPRLWCVSDRWLVTDGGLIDDELRVRGQLVVTDGWLMGNGLHFSDRLIVGGRGSAILHEDVAYDFADRIKICGSMGPAEC